MAFHAGTMGTAWGRWGQVGGRGILPAAHRLRSPLVLGVQIPDAVRPSWGACQEQRRPQRGPQTGTKAEAGPGPHEAERAIGQGQSTGDGGGDQRQGVGPPLAGILQRPGAGLEKEAAVQRRSAGWRRREVAGPTVPTSGVRLGWHRGWSTYHHQKEGEAGPPVHPLAPAWAGGQVLLQPVALGAVRAGRPPSPAEWRLIHERWVGAAPMMEVLEGTGLTGWWSGAYS